MLQIHNLIVSIKNKTILNNINLKINSGEVHAIMGPNGSGKSSLCYTLAGKQEYQIDSGYITFQNEKINNISPEYRACKGLFVSFQNPIEIPGISIINFINTAITEIFKNNNLKKPSAKNILKNIYKNCELLNLNTKLLNRSLNENFSGGEKKKIEIFQMMMLNPSLLVLDEIDSGLDIDSLKDISKVINIFKNKNKAIIIITHYQRILNYIIPDYVHVLNQGTIIKTGNKILAQDIEEKGYKWIL
jgi:Fe-S cluster assembly ATP-binding protein